MNIETEFDLNEIAYYMYDSQICFSRIEQIKTFTQFDGIVRLNINIVYVVMSIEGDRLEKNEREIFKNIDALVEYLLETVVNMEDCKYSRY